MTNDKVLYWRKYDYDKIIRAIEGNKDVKIFIEFDGDGIEVGKLFLQDSTFILAKLRDESNNIQKQYDELTTS